MPRIPVFVLAAYLLGTSALLSAQSSVFQFNIEDLGLGSFTELRGPFSIEVDGDRGTREWLIMRIDYTWTVVAERPGGRICIGTPFDYRVGDVQGQPVMGYIEWPMFSEAMGRTVYIHRYGPWLTLKLFDMPC